MGTSWLRGKGRELAAEGKPWFLAVNLVNPHDVMFYDTDAPGTPVRPLRGLGHVARDPVDRSMPEVVLQAAGPTMRSRWMRLARRPRTAISCVRTTP